MWLLLLVVAALANSESRFTPHHVSIVDPKGDFLHHVLFEYRISPEEVYIRNRGQNPINYAPSNTEPLSYVVDDTVQRTAEDEPGFHRAHIESHPAQVHHSWAPYSFNDIFDDEADEQIFYRGAVEQIPIEAQRYMADNVIQEDGPFSRAGVESPPSIPSPYSWGYEDEDLNAVVMSADDDDNYGKVGYRAGVESPPIRNEPHDPEESYPMPSSLNSRPFGHLSEATLSAELPGPDNTFGNNINLRQSMAGGDIVQYQANIRSQNGDYKLVCYYGGWSVYRPAPFDFSVTDIDPFSCTHVIYSFAGLKENEYTIQALDEELDIIKGAYKAAVGLKQQNPALKVMIAIGGWNEGGKKYSAMASTKERRDKFVQSVISFLQEHQFDGLDLDWEYPGASDRGGRWADKKNFADLVEELAVAFRPHGWILSAAVSPARFRVNEGYDVPRLAQHLDFINIMTYDLRGPWDGKADHHSPIESRPTDAWAFKSLNTKDGINYWAEKGAPKNKLLMGIPFYGRSFTLSNPSNTAPGSSVKSGGTEGQYTQERGFLAYYEVCLEEGNGGWTFQQDAAGGPYMTKGDQWVGYDDKGYIAKKMEMVKSEGLGGAMIWAIDLDDYVGVCGEKWPLLTTMRRGLGIKATGLLPAPEPILPVTKPKPSPVPDPTPEPEPSPEPEPEPEPSPNPEPVSTTEEDTGTTAFHGGTTLRPTTLAPTEATAATNFTCPGPGFHRSAEDCASYYLCDASLVAYRFTCPAGLVFDTLRRLCNWPRHVKCGKGYAALSVCTEDGLKFCLPGNSLRIENRYESQPTFKSSGEKKVICYYTSWAYYRPEPHKYAPEFVDPTLCTHIIYSYSMLDGYELIMRSLDPYLDFDYSFYQRIIALKRQSPTLKVMLALGGWVDSVGDKYSRLVSDPEARTRFVQHTTDVLKAYGFDGLDFGWMYPRCWQSSCSKGPVTDVANFALLIKELKTVFNVQSPQLLLSAAVTPARNIIDKSYDVPALSRYLDFINVLTYDFHGAWEFKTGHISPLFFRPEDKYQSQNTDYAMKHWVSKGADKSKLIMGIPFYGQTFTLANPGQNSLNAPVTSGGESGPFTKQRGMMAYFEICKLVRSPGWSKAVDPTGAIGPFAHAGNQWLSYEDPASVTRKADYIKANGYGGAMVWDLSFDDRLNECCTEPYPLLRAINRVLRSVPYPPPRPGGGNCSPPPGQVTPPTPILTTTYASATGGRPTTPTWGRFNISRPGEEKKTTTPSWMSEWRPTTTSTRITPTTTPSTTTSTTTSTTVTTPRTTSPWWQPPITMTTTTTTKRPFIPIKESPPTPPPRPPPSSPLPPGDGGKQPGERCREGEYYPKPGDCKSFFRCRNGQLEESRCTPRLHWNQRLKICDWPANANCQPIGGGIITTTSPSPITTTTRRTTTPRTPTSWWRPPTTTTSTRQTWWTPGPTRPWWETKPPTTPRSTITSTTHRPTSPPTRPPVPTQPPPQSSGPCQAGKATGVPGNCNSFRQCIGGSWVSLSCAPGLHWNEALGICDWPHLAKCSSTAAIRVPDAQSQPVTSSSPCQQEGAAVQGPQCTTGVICKRGLAEVEQCTGGLVWNPKERHCDLPSRVPNCGNVVLTPSSEALRPSVTVGPEQTAPGVDVNIPCQEGEYKRNPTNCGAYFLCVHKEWQEFSCQAPLQWDQNKRICDWPSNVNCKAVPANDQSISIGGGSTTPKPPTTPQTIVDLQPVSGSGSLSGDYMVVCYFTNWAWYRPGIGKYKPEDIDPTICTHIVYGFAVLDYSNLVIKTHDSWADIDNKFYEKVTALRSRGIKVTLAIGGWNDSLGDKYSRLVNNPSARRKFINHVIEFIKKYNFDGLDLDWEYPVCWQVDCKKGPKSDKENFALWVKELKEAFEPHGLLLSAAVSPSKKVIDEGYDVPMLNRYLDWIAVMTYDFHGHWDKKTGHVAPMFYHPESDYDYFNMDYAIRYWLEKGASKNKIVLGMPLYGQSFSIDDPQNTGLNSPARSGGQAGPFTRARGFLAYYEICHNIRQGWTVVKDPESRIGPYAYSGNQWVSFDDTDMLRRKSQYIRDMDLAGGMVWALDLDDFTNRCGQGAHPLMNTIKAVLGAPKGIRISTLEPTTPSTTSTTKMPGSKQPTTTDMTGSGTVTNVPAVPSATDPVVPSKGGDYKVVCYFTNWAWYRNGEGKYTPSEIDPSLCTHIVYGFAVLDGSRLVIKPHDTWADYDNKFYERVTALRSTGVKVLVAIGGWNDSAGDKYSRLVSNPATRRRFIEHVISFIRDNNFDGLDLDWEYPVCWQVDCKKGPAEDKANFAAFVKELNEAFKPHNLLLSAAVSPSNKVIDMGYDVPALDRYLDWIAVMTYDYHGQWDKKTGHVAPMYAHSQDDNLAFNTNFTIHYWIEKGADRKKLVLGMPMYGQSFSLAQASDNGLNQKTYGGGEAGPYTRARGFLAYYEICYKIMHEGWQVVKDTENSMGPYAYRGDQWVGFDDIETIRYKTKWLKNMGLGGAMIWALDLDDFRNRCGCEHHPLLRTINRELRNNQGPDPGCAPLGGTRQGGEVTPRPTPFVPRPTPSTAVPKQSCQAGTREPHESDCRKFYECVHGEKQERQCFPGLHWNAKANRCDWPNEAGCSSSGTPVTPTEPTPPPTTTTTPSTTTSTAVRPTTPDIPRPGTGGIQPQLDTGYKVVCYFTNWAWYRQGIGKYKPEDIDPDLCTHIVYGFAVLDGTRLLIKPHDTWADYDNEFYRKVTDMRARGVKVLIAIGGWNDSAGDKYSRLVNNPAARAAFNSHVIEFILKNNFDGLDLDWEYPVCWQVDCAKGNPNDKQAFGDWVRELHTAFQPHGLLLTAAVSPSNKVIDAGYDVPIVNRYLDWINVMTYDYHGHWDKKTGHVAPMYHHPGHENPAFNANYTIHYWIEKGADRKKLIMGMPMYGQAFGLGWKADGTGLGQHAPQKGQAGQYTRAAGFLAYYEICDKVLNGGFTVVKDPEGRMGPYAYSGKQWFGYDDIAMIRYKSEYIKKMGLGGGMIWALDLDDFRNRCGCENHPLLRTINRVLRNYPVPDPRCNM
ncbi:probable chitinase 10 isoform X2 [Palaemon carinicauda]|uniref:probable chitinase 10 isoform X2 n=1 Tax=Palaemon carinicauda TaxID=392227 RepID=UPI0035B5A3D2